MLDIKSYQRRIKSDGSTILSLECGPVPHDHVYQLLNMTGHHDNQAVTEATLFYFTSEGNPHYIHTGLPVAIATPVSFSEKIIIPQGYRFGIYCPNVANTEWIHLYVTGIIMPLCDFKEYVLKK